MGKNTNFDIQFAKFNVFVCFVSTEIDTMAFNKYKSKKQIFFGNNSMHLDSRKKGSTIIDSLSFFLSLIKIYYTFTNKQI